MSQPGFTKGPYRVQRNKRLEIISTVEPIAGCGWGQAVAHIYRAGKMNGTPYRMPAEANARLFAAAPDLYEACKTMQASLNGSPGDFAGMLAAHRKLDAAVALVESEPSDAVS